MAANDLLTGGCLTGREKRGGPPIVWFGHRGLDARQLACVGEVAGNICCDWSDELATLARDVPVLSIERQTGVRELWSSASLALHAKGQVRGLIEAACEGVDGPVVVVPYRSTTAIEQAIREVGTDKARLAGAPARLVDRLDDKLLQRQLFAAHGLPAPAWNWIPSASLEDRKAQEPPVAFPAVLQGRRGSLGRGTFMLRTWEERRRFAGMWDRDETLLLSQMIDGPAVNVNAVVGREHTTMGWPSVMITGAPECCLPGAPFAYCGNDFGAACDLPPPMIEALFGVVERVGGLLRSKGFLGLFGVDLICDGANWWLLEVNPRLQGSTSLLTMLELDAGLSPLVLEHMQAFLGAEDANGERPSNTHLESLGGSQVVVYHRGDGPGRMRGKVRSHGGKVGKLPPADDWTYEGFPADGTAVSPGAITGRLLGNARALAHPSLRLLAEAATAVASASARIV